MKDFSKFKKGDLLEIVWEDTYNLALPAWAVEEEIEEEIKRVDNIGGVVCKTCGYFYCVEKRHLYVCGDIMDNLYSRLTGIPIGCVKKVVLFKKGR